MKVLIKPDLESQGSGLTSTIIFDNADFIAAVRSMFRCKSDEVIGQIEIQDERITARISKRKEVNREKKSV